MRIIFLLSVVFLLNSFAFAEERAWRVELTPSFGFVAGGTLEDEFTNDELELDDSDAFGLQINVRADQQTSYEFAYTRQKTQTDTTPTIDVTIDKLEIGGTYEFSVESTRPFVAATVGVSRFKPEDSAFQDDEYFSMSFGGGVKFFTDRRVGITLDARWLGAVIDSDTELFCLSAGGLTCLIQTEAGVVSQFRVFVGFNARF